MIGGRHGYTLVGLILFVAALGSAMANPSFALGPFAAAERPVEAEPRSIAERSPISTAPTIPVPPPPPTTASPLPVTPAAAPPDENWAPKSVRVPAIGVDAPIDPMGVDDQQALEVPEDTARVGWWSGGGEPGEVAPAVLVGHVDSYTGPGVFFDLEKLVPGDLVEVDRSDGTTATFMVERLESYPKSEFPTDAVYGDTEWPALRLVTCIGPFDEAARSYQDNLVAYATLVG